MWFVVSSDETGINIHQAPNQKTGEEIKQKCGWMWMFQFDTLIYLTVLFSSGFPTAIYVTDCRATQLKVTFC